MLVELWQMLEYINTFWSIRDKLGILHWTSFRCLHKLQFSWYPIKRQGESSVFPVGHLSHWLWLFPALAHNLFSIRVILPQHWRWLFNWINLLFWESPNHFMKHFTIHILIRRIGNAKHQQQWIKAF